VGVARGFIRQDPFRGGKDRNAQAAHDGGNPVISHIDSPPRSADSPKMDDPFSAGIILQEDPNDFMLRIAGCYLEILDLREEIWIDDGHVVTKRQSNMGDPRGNTEVNLKENTSEFFRHTRSKKGYFGADYSFRAFIALAER
jgi:hypothetical protein